MGYALLSMSGIAISDASLVTSGEARLSLSVAWRKRTATILTVSTLNTSEHLHHATAVST